LKIPNPKFLTPLSQTLFLSHEQQVENPKSQIPHSLLSNTLSLTQVASQQHQQSASAIGILLYFSHDLSLTCYEISIGISIGKFSLVAADLRLIYGNEFEDLCLILCTCDGFEGFLAWVAGMGVLEQESVG
jgi:hypothetical protein